MASAAALTGARLATVAARAAVGARPAFAFAAVQRRSSSSSVFVPRRTVMSEHSSAPAPSTVVKSAEVDAAPTADAPAAAAEAPEITKLDIRVGKILSIEVHPDADG